MTYSVLIGASADGCQHYYQPFCLTLNRHLGHNVRWRLERHKDVKELKMFRETLNNHLAVLVGVMLILAMYLPEIG